MQSRVHRVVVEEFGQELDLQVHSGVDPRDQSQRIVRAVHAGDVDYSHARDIGIRCQPETVDRERFEHRHRVEHRSRTGHPLDFGETDELVVEQGRLFGLDTVEQLSQGLVGVETDVHRHCVDEQSDHRFDARDPRGPSGHHRTERHIIPRCQRAQHDCP